MRPSITRVPRLAWLVLSRTPPRATSRTAAARGSSRRGPGLRDERRERAGERQLTLIARALATEAAHVLMDEPAANLDYGNQSPVLEEIDRLRALGASILFSTHHPDHALRIADRVVMLRDGAMMACGATEAVVNSENLSALYGRRVEVALVASTRGTPRRVCVPSSGRQR